MVDVQRNSNISGGHFLYTLKIYQLPTYVLKAQFIAKGYNGRDKSDMVHDTSTARPSSILVKLFTASICGFQFFTRFQTSIYAMKKQTNKKSVITYT